MSTMHSPVSSALVQQFFDREKEDTRQWLRGEMDLLVDNMFTQLKTKFMNFLECDESTRQPNCTIDSNYQTFNAQVSQTAIHDLLPQTEQVHLNQNQTNYLEPQVLIKEEEMDENNDIWAQSSVATHSQIPLYALIKDHDDDDEDCDCDRCVNGGINIKEDDDEDEGTMIDSEDIEDRNDSDEDTWPPTKRQRIDKGEFPKNGNVITLSLQCISPKCKQMFSTKDQLNEHLVKQHDIHRYRCVVKNCHKSFTNAYLKNHLNEDHSNITEWQCDKCPKHYTSYKHLYNHTANFHHLGQYQCAFSKCTFVAKCKGEVDLHQKTQHKPNVVCSFPGCGYKLRDVTRLKAHERTHLGIEPYRCKWPDCGYSNAARSTTMNHIRRIHLDYNPKKRNVPAEQVRQYLEIVE